MQRFRLQLFYVGFWGVGVDDKGKLCELGWRGSSVSRNHRCGRCKSGALYAHTHTLLFLSRLIFLISKNYENSWNSYSKHVKM